ncbi:MAG TPA: chorismate mutase [Chloroflexota bacterium]|nr:chorismate mutase [Chloroflexota bacterium]
MRAIRGAITVEQNTDDAITAATQELLAEVARTNRVGPRDTISMFFTLTPDLDAVFPARGARAMGWDVPMLDMQEVPVPGALERCLRVLLHVEGRGPVHHCYLGGARALRPDLAGES